MFKVKSCDANFSNLLLLKQRFCVCRSVPLCVPPLLEALLALAEDEEEEVKSTAKSVLERVSQKCEECQGRSLTQVLQESFFTLAASLPATFNHAGNFGSF